MTENQEPLFVPIGSSGKIIHVLLVDDHALVRKSLKEIIAKHLHIQVVAEANDGLAAVDATRKWHPDVVIMDINMPRMDGLEATKRIKEMFPHTAVIGLSMQRAVDVEELAREAGMCAYLTKESVSSTLCPAIEDAVRTNPSRLPST